jgi:hypothetical protein
MLSTGTKFVASVLEERHKGLNIFHDQYGVEVESLGVMKKCLDKR